MTQPLEPEWRTNYWAWKAEEERTGKRVVGSGYVLLHTLGVIDGLVSAIAAVVVFMLVMQLVDKSIANPPAR